MNWFWTTQFSQSACRAFVCLIISMGAADKWPHQTRRVRVEAKPECEFTCLVIFPPSATKITIIKITTFHVLHEIQATICKTTATGK